MQVVSCDSVYMAPFAHQKITTPAHIEQLPVSLTDWPVASRRVAENMVARYGLPNEATESQLIWHYNSPWKRTVVFREGTLHGFPRPHLDVVAQTVDYQVPIPKIEELAYFDGSIVVDITKEEMTAHCGSEAVNCMILNLAHDIIIGQRTVDQSREALRHMAGTFRLHWPQEYAQRLNFDWSMKVRDRER